MARYRERSTATVDSARCGGATWSSERVGEVRCQRQEARRYWHHRVQ